MAPGVRMTFVGPGSQFDRVQVAQAGHDYHTVACPRSPRTLKDTARFACQMPQGYRAALSFLRTQRASLVVGLGGFASIPAALAAARLKPLVLLEQNMIVGRANRRLAPWANALCPELRGNTLVTDSHENSQPLHDDRNGHPRA